MEEGKKVTIPDLYAMVARGERITFLTAYDYPTALLEDRAGIDMILVGDSAAMCLLGHATTLPAKMDFMVEITAAVSRAAKRACLRGGGHALHVLSALKRARNKERGPVHRRGRGGRGEA